MTNNFKIGNISEKFHQLTDKIRFILKENNINLLKSLDDKLKEIEKNKILTVSFIGQYSSGKSTIISALTGDKSIKIDADIATDSTKDYKYNNIILTDTPGLYTDRPEHDQITNDKIKDSDLLIYCLTSDLFDDIVLENFKNLAFVSGYKNKMMIVINKMSMESGEYQELVKNYKLSLRKSLIPYIFDEFTTSFIDASDYIEGMQENNDSLLEISHFNEFINNLNNFISLKGFLGKLDTPIRSTITFIDNFIIETTNKDETELFQTLERIEYSINKNMERTQNSVKLKINELTLQIIKKSNEVTGKIGNEKFDLETESKSINIYIEKEIEKVRNEIQSLIEEQNKFLEEQLLNITETDIYKYVFKSIETGKLKLNDATKKELFNFNNKISKQKIEGAFKIVSKTVGEVTKTSTTPGFATPTNVSGAPIVPFIKDVGHFFGTKFKPWEAINLAKNIGNFFKILGPTLSAIFLIIDINDLIKQEENAKLIADSKKKCYSEFLKITDQIENQFNYNFESFKKVSYLKTLEEIRVMRNKILSERDLNDKMSKELLLQKKELEKLLIEIYS